MRGSRSSFSLSVVRQVQLEEKERVEEKEQKNVELVIIMQRKGVLVEKRVL